MSKDKSEQAPTEELAVMPPALVDRLHILLAEIPEADPEEATMSILRQILEAESPEELDDPWDGEGMKKLIGRLVQVNALKRLPSDFEDGPDWYLGCDCLLVETRESVFVTTGSVPVMVQLIHAHQKGWLPMQVVPRLAERKSRAGYYPMHLEIAR